jgi:threonine dehydrogenase-like Zn-dependent dehydrogenase
LQVDASAPAPSGGAGEAVIDVLLAGICATDLEIVRGYMNFRGILGHEFVGRVRKGPGELIGKRVVGEINCVCGKCDLCQSGLSRHCRKRTVLGIAGRDGAFAEQLALPVMNLHLVPDALSDEEAVFVEPLAAAIQVVQQCKIEPRMQVTVIGPGRLGLLVAQVVARTGCKLDVVGRSAAGLEFCEKKGIQPVPLSSVVPRADRDVVVECSGSPEGLRLAMTLVRPRGTIVLKSTYAGGSTVDLAPIVVNEVTVLGSRCGPFPEALKALARRDVEVASMVSRKFELSRAAEAFEAARDPRNIKVLLKP